MDLVHRQFNNISKRRDLSPEEEALVEEEKGKIIPKIFATDADNPAVDMSSPWWTAAIPAAAGGLAGAAVGNHLARGGDVAPSGDPGAITGTVLGGTAGALGLGALAYLWRKTKNENIAEQMRRMPEGATRRDTLSDPVVQADLERSNRLQAALLQAKHANLKKVAHEKVARLRRGPHLTGEDTFQKLCRLAKETKK